MINSENEVKNTNITVFLFNFYNKLFQMKMRKQSWTVLNLINSIVKSNFSGNQVWRNQESKPISDETIAENNQALYQSLFELINSKLENDKQIIEMFNNPEKGYSEITEDPQAIEDYFIVHHKIWNIMW